MNSIYEFQLCELREMYVANNRAGIKQFMENENIDVAKISVYQNSVEHRARLRMNQGPVVSLHTLELEKETLNILQ